MKLRIVYKNNKIAVTDEHGDEVEGVEALSFYWYQGEPTVSVQFLPDLIDVPGEVEFVGDTNEHEFVENMGRTRLKDNLDRISDYVDHVISR